MTGAPLPEARHLVLIGLMGAGKTTVGRRCARAAGSTVRRHRRPRRRDDGNAVRRVLRRVRRARVPGSRTTGGCRRERVTGTARHRVRRRHRASTPRTASRLRATGTVVWLQAPVPVLANRVGAGESRPLLAGDPVGALTPPRCRRAKPRTKRPRTVTSIPARCDVDAGGRRGAGCSTSEPTHDRAGARRPRRPRVRHRRRYWSGRRARVGARRPPEGRDRHSGRHRADVRRTGCVQPLERARNRATSSSPSPTERTAKTLDTVDELSVASRSGGCCVPMQSSRSAAVSSATRPASRRRCTTAASMSCRSRRRCSRWSTAAIGGKTGVNLPEGKNLVGAFHQPRAVLIDPALLATLPDREFRCGLGEVVKYALLGDDELASASTIAPTPCSRVTRPSSPRSIARCVRAKAAVVAADEFERTGIRAALNLGHTAGHAIESAANYALAHGEAVAVGLVFATNLAAALERIPPSAVERADTLVRKLGLSASAPPGLQADELLELMARDKKSEGTLTFVLPGPNGIERVDDPDRAAIDKALAAIGVSRPDGDDPLAVRPEPQPARRAGAAVLRHHHPRGARGARARDRGQVRPRARARAIEPRGHVDRRDPRRARPLRSDRVQRGCLLALRLRADRRTRRRTTA